MAIQKILLMQLNKQKNESYDIWYYWIRWRILKKILDDYIHFNLNDMQVVEDLQMFVCHVCCKWLSKKNFSKNK